MATLGSRGEWEKGRGRRGKREEGVGKGRTPNF